MGGGANIAPGVVQNLHPNNTNTNNTNITAANREDATAVAADFKKIKEKGEEKMEAVRERMVELDFEIVYLYLFFIPEISSSISRRRLLGARTSA
jgi:undecaprenyl pyrophosphate synthase